MSQMLASSDGRYLAQVLTDGTFQIIDLLAASQRKHFSSIIHFPSSVRQALSEVRFLRWSPEQIVIESTAEGEEESLKEGYQSSKLVSWLAIASTHRLLVLEVQIPHTTTECPVENHVLADIEFPKSNGKISALDFVFDHNSVLIMFDIAPHATILSLAKAQRDELPSRKFSTAQSYAISKDAISVALLVRDKHADFVALFKHGEMVTSFKAETIDAHGIMWCPDGRPVLCVWDSAAYGTKVHFYTAMGHTLKQLDIFPNSFFDHGPGFDLPGTGVSAIAWSLQAGSRTNTALTIGDGSRRIIIRRQNSQSLTVEHTSVLEIPKALNGFKTQIWQQVERHLYQQETGIWELKAGGSGTVTMISISADGQRIASVAECQPNVILIWQIGKSEPISAMILQRDVRQILWHPSFSTVLTITTNAHAPDVHVWYGTDTAPLSTTIPRLHEVSSSKWEAKWLTRTNDNEGSHVFTMSSMKYFDAGSLGVVEGGLVFESVFFDDKLLPPSDESTLQFETPSKTVNNTGIPSASIPPSAYTNSGSWISASQSSNSAGGR